MTAVSPFARPVDARSRDNASPKASTPLSPAIADKEMDMASTTTDPLNALLAIRDGYRSSRWNFPLAVGSSTTNPAGIGQGVSLQYSFLSAVPSYYGTMTGFRTMTTAEKEAVRSVLASIASMIDVDFTETTAVASITFAMNAQDNSSGYAYFPSYRYYTSGNTITSATEDSVAGDVWLNSSLDWDADSFLAGDYGYGTLVHELGHALGLKHPFEADSASGYVIDAAHDSTKYTVMSYTDHPYSLYRTVTVTGNSYSISYRYIQPETLMPYDISALQYLYGANLSYNTGNDTYTFETDRPFIKTIWDAGGTDTLSVANFSLGCIIDLRPGYYSSIRIPSDAMPAGTTETYTGIYDGTDNLAIAAGVVIENATGGSGNDQLIGNDADNTLDGGAGNDTMTGGAGSDTYTVRNAGDSVVETDASTAGGIDLAATLLTAYTLPTNVERGRILATGAADLTGNALDNLLYAGQGSNVLSGAAGNDVASYIYAITGTTGVTLSLDLTSAQATGGSGNDTLIGIESIVGSVAGDTLAGNSQANTLNGDAGNDKLQGLGGNDKLLGSLGNDTLDGGTGNDLMLGGAGNDLYVVNAPGDRVYETTSTASSLDAGGIDTIKAAASWVLGSYCERLLLLGTSAINGTGNDLANLIYASAGNNVLNGGDGTDTLSYSTATAGVTVSLNLTTAQNTVGSGTDTLSNFERLSGSGFGDTLTGSGIGNLMDGDAGNDTILGLAGNDVLRGSLGADVLYGGAGNDIFDYNAVAESGTTSTTWDVIMDFTAGQDRIDLSGIDANTATTANDAFTTLLASSATFTAAGQLRFTNGMLYANTDTDSAAEFALKLNGSSSLAIGSIIL